MFKTNEELLKAIDPKLKPSYSTNIHEWMKAWTKKHSPEHLPEVWKTFDNVVLIGKSYNYGQDSSLVGVRLFQVFVDGTRANRYTCSYLHHSATQTEDFWEQYLEIGRCAYDTEHNTHFLDTENRYTYNSETNTRKCNWCGAEHKRRVEVKTTTKELVYYDKMVPQTHTVCV